jgi:hypothetical protein
MGRCAPMKHAGAAMLQILALLQMLQAHGER